ncbi:MAG TPA: NUDIX hydrolase [Acidimicrobiales bacterium]
MSPRSPVPDADAEPQVRAAGGVVWRVEAGVVSVALVHRPKYGDWTFPKGKLEAGESDEHAAHREVVEETGLECVLGRELPEVRYLDNKGRSKLVRYWEMTVASGSFAPNDEVDRLEWLPLEQAARRLTYGHDSDVLEAFAEFAMPVADD